MAKNTKGQRDEARRNRAVWATFTMRVLHDSNVSLADVAEEIIRRMDAGPYSTGPIVDACTPEGRED